MPQIATACDKLRAALTEVQASYASVSERGTTEVAISPELYRQIDDALSDAPCGYYLTYAGYRLVGETKKEETVKTPPVFTERVHPVLVEMALKRPLPSGFDDRAELVEWLKNQANLARDLVSTYLAAKKRPGFTPQAQQMLDDARRNMAYFESELLAQAAIHAVEKTYGAKMEETDDDDKENARLAGRAT